MLPCVPRRRFLTAAALARAEALLPRRVAAAPALPKGLVFLFQGDSITDGNRGRSADPNHVLGHGYAFAVASRIGADFPAQGFAFYNRGVSGNKVADLQRRWPADALALKPDVLSILVGINDANATVTAPAEAASLANFDYPAVFDQAAARQSIEYWVWHGIYPTAFAHELMAREWLKQVSHRLDFLRKYEHEF